MASRAVLFARPAALHEEQAEATRALSPERHRALVAALADVFLADLLSYPAPAKLTTEGKP